MARSVRKTSRKKPSSTRRKASPAAQVESLLNPRNIVIIGASDRAGSWTERVWRNIHRYGFKKPVYPLNPGRDEVWDVRCYRDFKTLPQKPDHLMVLVPAKAVPTVLRQGAKAGARSATVMTSGFDELGTEEGRAYDVALRAAIKETGLAVSGPNCFGNLVSKSSLLTMPDDRPQRLASGPVAIIGQSGGLCTAIKRTLEERGVDVSTIVTGGNEAGLTTADYIRYFVADPETRVIVCYLEGINDRDGFLDALGAARAAGKPVVVAKLGTSEQGRTAALAHTGALAGAVEAFDAVAGAAGAIRVTTLDDVVETVEFLLHAKLPKGGGLGAITLSGGLRGMMLDAGARNGLNFTPLSPASQKTLEKLVGVGAAVGNPLDGGFAVLSSQDAYIRCIEVMLADPGIDMLLLQEELPRAAGTERKERYLRAAEALAKRAKKPIIYVSMISYGLTEYSREFRAGLPHLPFLQEVDKSVRMLGRVADYVERGRHRTRPAKARANAATKKAAATLARASRGKAQPVALNEPASKAILAAYGVPVLEERLARSAAAAAAAAAEIGFPVVLKGVSADLPHKSDAGAVLIGLGDANAVAKGFERITKNVARAKPGLKLDGVLVAPMAAGGLELALGIANDPEVGPVIMFGQGGVALELYRDVAIAAPDLDTAAAHRLIARTKVGALMGGFRGGPRYDAGAVADALVALGRLARTHGDQIEAVDVNPFVVRPRGKGAVALDGLVIVRPRNKA